MDRWSEVCGRGDEFRLHTGFLLSQEEILRLGQPSLIVSVSVPLCLFVLLSFSSALCYLSGFVFMISISDQSSLPHSNALPCPPQLDETLKGNLFLYLFFFAQTLVGVCFQGVLILFSWTIKTKIQLG